VKQNLVNFEKKSRGETITLDKYGIRHKLNRKGRWLNSAQEREILKKNQRWFSAPRMPWGKQDTGKKTKYEPKAVMSKPKKRSLVSVPEWSEERGHSKFKQGDLFSFSLLGRGLLVEIEKKGGDVAGKRPFGVTGENRGAFNTKWKGWSPDRTNDQLPEQGHGGVTSGSLLG